MSEKSARVVKYCETCGLIRVKNHHGELTCKCFFVPVTWPTQKINHKPARKYRRKNDNAT